MPMKWNQESPAGRWTRSCTVTVVSRLIPRLPTWDVTTLPVALIVFFFGVFPTADPESLETVNSVLCQVVGLLLCWNQPLLKRKRHRMSFFKLPSFCSQNSHFSQAPAAQSQASESLLILTTHTHTHSLERLSAQAVRGICGTESRMHGEVGLAIKSQFVFRREVARAESVQCLCLRWHTCIFKWL